MGWFRVQVHCGSCLGVALDGWCGAGTWPGWAWPGLGSAGENRGGAEPLGKMLWKLLRVAARGQDWGLCRPGCPWPSQGRWSE